MLLVCALASSRGVGQMKATTPNRRQGQSWDWCKSDEFSKNGGLKQRTNNSSGATGHRPGSIRPIDSGFSKLALAMSKLHSTVGQQRLINRAHSFPRVAEFRAEPRNLPFAAEFRYFRGILQKLTVLFFITRQTIRSNDNLIFLMIS